MTKLDQLIVHQPTEEPYGDIAPLRVLSFDIECASDPGVFPTPDKHQVIQISCVCKEQNSTEPFAKIVFTQGSCAAIRGAELVTCRDEKTLLKKWSEFVCEVDPDVITGYNIQNFDISYLVDRAKHLKISPQVLKIGRVANAMCRVHSSTFSSAQMGTRQTKQVSLDGRIVFDVFQVSFEYLLALSSV
jgi:DNA polymerase delta subunit 1